MIELFLVYAVILWCLFCVMIIVRANVIYKICLYLIFNNHSQYRKLPSFNSMMWQINCWSKKSFYKKYDIS